MKAKQIGIEVELPRLECNDINCPFHGNLKVRGRMFVGKVTRADTSKSATVEFIYYYYLPKYERYEKRTTRLKVYNPSCINAKIGDKVRIIESRPIAKTKNFVIIEVIKK
ncbi:MAG: 30S ribosomal protein S17 [Nanoarchaeota archaeon]